MSEQSKYGNTNVNSENFRGNPSNYVEILYENLWTIKDNGALVPGKMYIITDYETIYIQPDWSDENTPKVIDSSMIKTGINEPLVVVATTTNNISKIAYSGLGLYQSDIIEYDVTKELLLDDGLNQYYTKGKITKRIDEANNQFSFDFRNVKFKRYDVNTETNVGDNLIYWDNGEASSEHYIFRFVDCQDNAYQTRISNNTFLYEAANGFPLDNLGFEFGIWNINTVIYTDENLINTTIKGFVINTNLTFVICVDFKIDGVSNNFYLNCSNLARANHFSGIFDKIRIQNGNTQANEFLGDFRQFYQIGNDCASNNFTGIFYDFTIGNAWNNTFIVRDASYVVLSGNFVHNNSVKCASFGGNSINTITHVAFQNNDINIVGSFKNNNITRILSSRFYGSQFSDNTGHGINSCFIEGSFVNNTLRTTGDSLGLQDSGSDPFLTRCHFKTSPNSIDLQTATHIYNNYDTDIFINSNENERLSYFNEFDSLIVTDIDE